MSKKNYYAIATIGKKWIGLVVRSWDECCMYVDGVKAEYKGFNTMKEAEDYLDECKEEHAELLQDQEPMAETYKAFFEDEYTFTDDQKHAMDCLLSGTNCFITGSAGTGKSYLLTRFLLEASIQGRKALVCAPTGIAALNVGGVTIHRAFKIPPKTILKSEPIKRKLDSFDIIVIDEISMVRIDLFEYVMRAIQASEKKKHKKIQIVVFGDFYQLPPVVGKDRPLLSQEYGENFINGYAFESDKWDEAGFRTIQLETVVRQQDAEFVDALNMARKGDWDCIKYFNEKGSKSRLEGGINLYGTNREVEAKNAEELNAIPGEEYTYEAEIDGTVNPSDKMTGDVVVLKEGCRVMLLYNDPKGRFQNGSLATVIHCNPDSVKVKIDEGKTVTVGPFIWNILGLKKEVDDLGETVLETDIVGTFTQIPLKLAYAITMHKSQGQTFEKVNLSPRAWDPGQLYVALSRVRTIDGLYMERKIYSNALIAANEVHEFMRYAETNNLLSSM